MRPWLMLAVLLAGRPAHGAMFSCEGVDPPDARAVVSMDESSITINGIPYVIEEADTRFIYARLDVNRASVIQREYFPNRSLAVDRTEGRIIEFKDQTRAFEDGNTVEWSCRSVKEWTGDPEPPPRPPEDPSR